MYGIPFSNPPNCSHLQVFSTLLSSLPNVSMEVRSSIQRNIMEMLNLHEHLLSELEISFNCHGRRRKLANASDITSRTVFNGMRMADSQVETPYERFLSTANSRSVESSASPGSPLEAADVARIFKKVVSLQYCSWLFLADMGSRCHTFSPMKNIVPSTTSWFKHCPIRIDRFSHGRFWNRDLKLLPIPSSPLMIN